MPKDKYQNFKELKKNEIANYSIVCVDRGSIITIIAPHGGKIEDNTTEIAEAIANDEFNYYSFIGERRNENKKLHITSHKFDEPKALELIGKSEIVIAIHGCKDVHSQRSDKKEIFIGGLNEDLKTELEKALIESSLHVSFLEKFAGEDEDNICNKGTTKAGIQFELTKSFRNDSKLRKQFIKIVTDVLIKNISTELDLP